MYREKTKARKSMAAARLENETDVRCSMRCKEAGTVREINQSTY